MILTICLFSSCTSRTSQINSIIISGKVAADTEYIVVGGDTLSIKEGFFYDTMVLQESYYDYIKLSDWQWAKLVYFEKGEHLNFDFTTVPITAHDNLINQFLLNSDSVLKPYSLRWDMDEKEFRRRMKSELQTNVNLIDSLGRSKGMEGDLIDELKDIERLKIAHRTANFVSFQERKGHPINRNIYDLIGNVDLNNKRLEKQVNNRNFQYYYLIDKVSSELPDSLYPYAVIDTVNKYSNIESIRKMIIATTIKSSFYQSNVDHDRLLSIYEENFEQLEQYDELYTLKEKVESLQPGNMAPSIGNLLNYDGTYTSLDDLRGKNILLTVWGTWCPYCKEQLPELKSLMDRYGDKFINVTLSFDTDVEKWKAYIEENEWRGIHLIDPKSSSTFKSNYLINSTNVHLVIDREGTIISRKGLKPDSKELEDVIRALD